MVQGRSKPGEEGIVPSGIRGGSQEERRGSEGEGKACEGGIGGERGEAPPPAGNSKMDGCDGKQRGEGQLEHEVA